MTPTAAAPVRMLTAYSGYRCRHSGVCCSAGWDIELDPRRAAQAAAAIHAGRVRMPAGGDAPPGGRMAAASASDGAVLLARAPGGACVFFDETGGRQCALHRGLGHAALPAACRQFPRVVLREADRTVLAFSHVCPAAAALLLEAPGRMDTGEAGHALGENDPRDLEGFDAASTPPPFLRPGVVFDPDSRDAWERFVLAVCDACEEGPTVQLARLADGAGRVRRWTPARGALAGFAADVLREALEAKPGRVEYDARAAEALWRLVREAVPPGLPPPPAVTPPALAAAWRKVESDAGSRRVIGRYLAARAFGSWAAYRGSGVRTQVAWLAVAAASLAATAIGAPPGTTLAGAAAWIGAADLWLVHRADDGAVVDALAGVEMMTDATFEASMGIGRS